MSQIRQNAPEGARTAGDELQGCWMHLEIDVLTVTLNFHLYNISLMPQHNPLPRRAYSHG